MTALRFVPSDCPKCGEPGAEHNIMFRDLAPCEGVSFGTSSKLTIQGPWQGFEVTCARCGWHFFETRDNHIVARA
jgi:hypothetical protein